MSNIQMPSYRPVAVRLRSLALLALLAGAVCAAASISAAMTHPVSVASMTVTPGVVVAVAEASRPVTAGAGTASPSPAAGTIAGMAVGPPPPGVDVPAATESLEPDLVLLGSWTVAYVVGAENGDGANIEIPLRRFDGLVLKPGATFDFWNAVGEVSRRTGYRPGGVIIGNHIDPDGALAGGICTVSTALFDAAVWAGLEIVSRTSHGGYLAKYPLGLDAAVAKGDGFRQTMAFRNDTTETIKVRTVSTPGIARVDLYGATALDRRVTFSAPAISHRRPAPDRHVRTAALPRGQRQRVEPASDGMTVSVTRTVRDSSGLLVHRDRFVSVYGPLTGLVRDGTG